MPDIPPTCLPVAITKPDGRNDQVFTYGSHFLWADYDHYDPLLRSTLARCMAHRPVDRPSMLELEALLEVALRSGTFPSDADADRIAVGELLGSPPPPRAAASVVEGTAVVAGTSSVSVARSLGLRSRMSTALRSIRRGRGTSSARQGGMPPSSPPSSFAARAATPAVSTGSLYVVRVPEIRETTDECECFNCFRRD